MEPKRNTSGEAFLHSKRPSLHVGLVVEHEQARRERAGEETHAKPADKIADWMEVLDKTHGHGDPRVLERIKQSYHDTFVIKPEDIPESAFLREQRIARNMGHGDIPITGEFRQAKSAEIISNQEASLDKWLDYLTSEDAMYPTWAKYWAFTSITKMGKFEKVVEKQEDGTEKEAARFAKRDETTTAPFPPLSPRALALTVEVMQEKLKLKGAPKEFFEGEKRPRAPRVPNASEKLKDEEFQHLLSTESFSEIYTQFLIELPAYSTEGLQETRGEWRVFAQGSDPEPLVDSLEGYPLEWCTANTTTAQTQLAAGDFYVYYSIDQDGSPSIPRAAIRMEAGHISEVRGIAPNQELDPYIAEVVGEKMGEFPDGEAYQKKAADMARLTDIEERHNQGQELTEEDLRFLYEVDGRIEGFGYSDDPRINLLLRGRKPRDDLVRVFNCRPEQISLTSAEATHGTAESPIVFHYGDLELRGLFEANNLILPQQVSGKLDLQFLREAKGLTLPKKVGKSLNLDDLQSVKNVILPEFVGSHLHLGSITDAVGLILPKKVNGHLSLSGLRTAKNVILPESVGGNLYLSALTEFDNLTFPSVVGGDLSLSSLEDGEGLTLPQEVSGVLSLHRLRTAEGVTLPTKVGDSLEMRRLESSAGLILPSIVGGGIYLSRYDGGGAGGKARVSGLKPEQLLEVFIKRPDLVIKLQGVPPWIKADLLTYTSSVPAAGQDFIPSLSMPNNEPIIPRPAPKPPERPFTPTEPPPY